MDRVLSVLVCLVILNGCGSRDAESDSSDLTGTVPAYELSLDREKSISISIIDTIGSAYGDTAMFGRVTDVDVYGNRIYVLDGRLSALSVFDVHTRSLIKRTELPGGAGPGEIYDPNQFCMDSNGNSYIRGSDSYIHIFDDELVFKTRSIYLATMLLLHAFNTEVFLIPVFTGRTEKPAVEVIDPKGDVVASFGHQHEDFEENWVNNQLQGTIYVFLATDNNLIYLAPALPLLIQTFTHGSYIQKENYTFTPEYAGKQVESPDGRWMYPTGLITGLCSYTDQELLVFTNDMESQITYLNLINTSERTYIECNLMEYIGEFIRYVIPASDGERLYIRQNDPFPHILIMSIEINTR